MSDDVGARAHDGRRPMVNHKTHMTGAYRVRANPDGGLGVDHVIEVGGPGTRRPSKQYG
jgi:hypothetical protein